MDKSQQLLLRLRKARWLLPVGLAVLTLLLAAGIALAFVSGLERLKPSWIFNLGADIVGIFICAVLYYGCMMGRDGEEETTLLFVSLLSTNGFMLFLDECAWLVQGVPGLRIWNITVNALFYAGGMILLYQFWRYIRYALELGDKRARLSSLIMQIALIPTTLLCFVNFFYPLYFSVDAAGVYRREVHYPLSYAYALLSVIILLIAMFRSDAPKRQKVVVVSFVALPILNAILTYSTFGISTQYVATLISIVLIYCVLFSDRSKSLAATQTELRTATQIQESMLPSVFPPYPDRSEFDLYASMDPAREVGGDFYDFFLVDDDHLCLVMADVSGKGVPAALFMMASKIILANNAKMGKTPAQILNDTNVSICSNNREEMFVTVWLGILEISTGRLTAANAGHEYPALRRADGSFELFKDKHGLVIGAMEFARYKEYELQLQPGDRLFVYTDGVPEATDAQTKLFGTERMLAALNEDAGGTPEEILKTVRRAVDGFVQGAEQFDDLTMLCLAYKGNGKGAGA
ncbi:MAG: serine/threonine-protein phosphatase [Oscillospiraceae bacterium]|nr:serine/threonine-protein phosphatase [Oscillospiraceae bacterium]